MKLETLLKPIKYIDENVILRQYTKLGKKINIDEGKRKYWIAFGLTNGIYIAMGFANRKLFDTTFDTGDFVIIGMNDGAYNISGLRGQFKEDKTSDSVALNPLKESYIRYNSIVRLPSFLFSIGLIGKFGIDLVNSIKNKTPIEPTSWYCLQDGIGHLALASSMYLKETDPKLLDKEPLWKKALNYVQEKIDLLGPQPVPVPVYNFQKEK